MLRYIKQIVIQNRLVKRFILFLFLLAVTGPGYSLIQLQNPGFAGNAGSWFFQSLVLRAFNMTDWVYNAGTGNPAGSFYGRWQSGGNNRTSDGILQQTFNTPDGPVNATMIFDRRKVRTGSVDNFRLYARILDAGSGTFPNEAGYTVFSELLTGNYAVPGTWENTGWSAPVLIDGNKTYIARIYMDNQCDNGVIAGAYLDNIQCNISPSGLMAVINGPTNDLSWTPSNGVIALHPANAYRIYRASTSGGPYALLGQTINNFWVDPAPPAGGEAYYVITDVDVNGLESPQSVEASAIRIVVRDGPGPDIAWSFFADRVELSWQNPLKSFIRYEAAVGTTPGGTQIKPWTDVGLTDHAVFSGLPLASGTRYFASVRGVDVLGAVSASGSSDGFVARRDQVLVDTASQTFFQNARVLNLVDTTTDADSIRPKIFSGTGGGGYWRYSVPVVVTEPGVTERINAPCRVQLAVPVGQMSNVNEIRVADAAGNEIPRYNLGNTVTAPDIVFLVNMTRGETRTYWIYWGNTGVSDPGYGFALNSNGVSTVSWTPYYSRKNLAAGMEGVPLALNFGYTAGVHFERAGNFVFARDDCRSDAFNLPWPFYFYGTNYQNGWLANTNGLLYRTSTSYGDYSNTFAEFTGNRWGQLIAPLWIDLKYDNVDYPQSPGVYMDVLSNPARVAFTWRTNRYSAVDDIYIVQAVLYSTGDVAFRYDVLSPRGVIGPGGTDFPVNTVNTVGLSNNDNARYMVNTPLAIGIGKTPTAFYQCMDAFRDNYVVGAITGGNVGTWVDVAHMESMIFDSRSVNPAWQQIQYDCAGGANGQFIISTRDGPTPLPELGGWTGWVDAATTAVSGAALITGNQRYLQYRIRFQRNGNGALPVVSEVRLVNGGISIEEIKATAPDGVSQGQNGIPVEVTIRNFYSAPVNLNSVQLTFSLGTHSQVLAGPALPAAIAAGGVTSVFFNVNVDNDSPVGTATIQALATASVVAPLLTFFDADAQYPHEWLIKRKAELVITQVETVPTHVNKGQSGIPVRMYIANIGETPCVFDGATLTLSLGNYVQALQSPAPGTIVPSLSSIIATFAVDVQLISPSGVSTIGGTASGANTFSNAITGDAIASITDSWTIQNPAQLVLEEIIASASVYRGQTNTPVFLRVSNPGEATAVWKSSDIISYFSLGTYDDVYPVSVFDIFLPGGMGTAARYGVDISPLSATGTSTVDADISGIDLNVGFPVGWTNALIPAKWTILAEKVNTWKDPVFTLPSTSFNRPAAGSEMVYALAEDVLPFGEFVVRWLDPSGVETVVSPVLTADASGSLAHELALTPAFPAGLWKVKVTNPINTYMVCENQFEVVSPASLSASFSMPVKVSLGQPFVASLTFINSGGADVDSAYPGALDLLGPGVGSLTAGPLPAVVDVYGNDQATVTFSFVAQTVGNFSASTTVYGFDSNSGAFLSSPSTTSNVCVIQSPPLLDVFSISAVPAIVYLNQKNLQIQTVIRNQGQAAAVLQTASLTFGLGTFDQTLTSPALPFVLNGGNQVTLTYDIGVSPVSATGLSIFSANVFWNDQNWPASSSYLTGSPPSDSWTVAPVGIALSANGSYLPAQEDFNCAQTVYVRASGLNANSQWYRIRLYNSAIAQGAQGPLGWANVSPQLQADGSGYIEHLYTLPAAATIGTWSVLVEDDADQSSATRGNMLGLQYFRVQNPGNLVASLTISPDSVFVGENFTVTLIAANTVVSGSTVANVLPGLLQSSGTSTGLATIISGPDPLSFSLKSGQSSAFVFTYRADSDTGLVGSYSLTVASAAYLSGNDLNTGAVVASNNGVSNHLTIYSRKLQLSSDTIDFFTLPCGSEQAVGNTAAQNIGNFQLDNVKWIITDLNGPGMQKISKVNLAFSPSPLGVIPSGSSVQASANLFVPYNQVAGTYIATMSIFNDRNGNDFFDIEEVYDLFNVKVVVPPCKRIFVVQDSVDLGGWSVGQITAGKNISVFSGGNLPLDNLRFMQTVGTNSFPINVLPANPGALAIAGSFIATVSADISVGPAGQYIATWTVWDDSANFGVIDPGEASDSFQVRVQVGALSYTLAPSPVDAGTIEPSAVGSGFGLTLTNTGSLSLKQLKTIFNPLSNGTGGLIASDGIGLNMPVSVPVEPLTNVPVTFALFVPAGTPAGLYGGTQYIYHDDNLNGVWDVAEFRAPFDLQVFVPLVPKVQVLVSTVGVGGIGAGTSKVVSFPCRNTGNVDLSQLRWEKTNLVSGASSIVAAQISFPPLEPFSVSAGQFFTHDIQVSVPVGQTFGNYLSSGGHYWLFEDLPVFDASRNAGEPQANFKVSCDVGELKVDVLEPFLSVSGDPNALSGVVIFNVKNIGTLQLARLKATGTVLLPTIAGPVNIDAGASVFNPVNLGSALIGQTRQSQWAVNVPANASAATYLGKLIAWEDSNNNNLLDPGEASDTADLQLVVNAKKVVTITQEPLDLGWAGKNTSTNGLIEVRNVGNLPLDNLDFLSNQIVFGANNIPAASITFNPDPLGALAVGAARLATVTAAVGAVQADGTYSGLQRVYDDYNAINSVWDAAEEFDTVELILRIGQKLVYETDPANPPLDFGLRNVNATYSLPLTLFNGTAVPLSRLKWKLISQLTNGSSIATLTFTPAGFTSIAGAGSRLYQANAAVGAYAAPGLYIATASFWDDDNNDNVIQAAEASATFNVRITVNQNYALDIADALVDFGQVARGATATREILLRNDSNVALDSLVWSFNPISHVSEPDSLADLSASAVFVPYPVPAGAFATATVSLFVPATKPSGNYGLGELQKLADTIAAGAEDTCSFMCEVIQGGPTVASGSVYQFVATSTFSAAAPDNIYFLSAYVAPGTGSAIIGYFEHDVQGKAVATFAVSINAVGNVVPDPLSAPLKHFGKIDKIPFSHPDYPGENFAYYRIFLAFERTFNSVVASDSLILLNNSSPDAGQPVWFDGIMLERAEPAQTRPSSYHPTKTLRSPNRELTIQGDRSYNEW